jgi:hypothetical protein
VDGPRKARILPESAVIATVATPCTGSIPTRFRHLSS